MYDVLGKQSCVHTMIVCIMTARIGWYEDTGPQRREPGWTNNWTNTGALPITPQYRLRKNRIEPHRLRLCCDQNRRRSQLKVNV